MLLFLEDSRFSFLLDIFLEPSDFLLLFLELEIVGSPGTSFVDRGPWLLGEATASAEEVSSASTWASVSVVGSVVSVLTISAVGSFVGSFVGFAVTDGLAEGSDVGTKDGSIVGRAVGSADGSYSEETKRSKREVGLEVVGASVGSSVGRCVASARPERGSKEREGEILVRKSAGEGGERQRDREKETHLVTAWA